MKKILEQAAKAKKQAEKSEKAAKTATKSTAKKTITPKPQKKANDSDKMPRNNSSTDRYYLIYKAIRHQDFRTKELTKDLKAMLDLNSFKKELEKSELYTEKPDILAIRLEQAEIRAKRMTSEAKIRNFYNSIIRTHANYLEALELFNNLIELDKDEEALNESQLSNPIEQIKNYIDRYKAHRKALEDLLSSSTLKPSFLQHCKDTKKIAESKAIAESKLKAAESAPAEEKKAKKA